MVLSQLSQTNTLVSDSYVRDEEGSGSGLHPSFEDDDDSKDPEDLEQGSGSGVIPDDGKYICNIYIGGVVVAKSYPSCSGRFVLWLEERIS